MIRIQQLKISIGQYSDDTESTLLLQAAAKRLGVKPVLLEKLPRRIMKKSVDARDKNDILLVYTLDIDGQGILNEDMAARKRNVSIVSPAAYAPPAGLTGDSPPPVVVGAGPAGLLAALVLARAGLNPILLERGAPVEARQTAVQHFWQTGQLNPAANVQFGEGGAGAFSDGKLTTGIHDPRIAYVLDTFVEMGAPEPIRYLAKPHIGTDKLTQVVRSLRQSIIALGGSVRFYSRVTDIGVEAGQITSIRIETPGLTYSLPVSDVILALGHSARDTFAMLAQRGLVMEAKPFAVGVRIEHSQRWLNELQYGRYAGHPALGATDYKLHAPTRDGRGCYTFCMCPGGYVVAAASEAGRLAVNGMSYYNRAGQNANSALLVGVTPADYAPSARAAGADEGVSPALYGIYLQQSLEEAAFQLGGGNFHAPVQLAGDFLAGQASNALGSVEPSYRPGVRLTDLRLCLPEFVTDGLREGLRDIERRLPGFAAPDAVLTAVESRSSSPVRLLRGTSLEGSIGGLFPCGEGAGYAGGIMSAAVDGVRCAEKVIDTNSRLTR